MRLQLYIPIITTWQNRSFANICSKSGACIFNPYFPIFAFNFRMLSTHVLRYSGDISSKSSNSISSIGLKGISFAYNK